MAQYHFLDDSGDPGLSGSKGSSSHLALAMVQLPERKLLSELAFVRSQFHFPTAFEFKYHKTKARHREAFFKVIKDLPFRVRAVVVTKTLIEGDFAHWKGDDLLIEFAARLLLRASPLDIGKDILVIDGTTPGFRRKLRIRISEGCRESNRVPPFRKIISGDSEREDGLQIADMIVGAVRRYTVESNPDYFSTFANKVVDLWQVWEEK